MKVHSAYFPRLNRLRLRRASTARVAFLAAALPILLIVSLMLPVTAWCETNDDFEMAMETITDLPEQDIIRVLTAAAEAGSPEAALALGNRFFRGDGVEENMDTAVKWWKIGSTLNSPQAAYNLGVANLNGYGTAKDLLKAQNAFTKAAEKGLPNAHLALGILGLHRAKTDEEFTNAGAHFRRAAELGSAVAGHNLALMYEKGLGYDKDEKQAKYWRSSGTPSKLAKLQSPTVATPYKRASTAGNIINTVQWVNDRAKEHYTLQLASGDTLGATEKLVSKITSLERAIFRKTLAGKERFVAIAGDFLSYSEALVAIENLPASFLENEPFIVKFKVIQRQIDEHTKINN